MSDNVLSIADKLNSGIHRTPENMLEKAIEEVRDGVWTDIKKMMVITVDEENQSYIVNWMQAGMKMSECLTLCEVAKIRFLSEMGYIENTYDDET